MFEDGHPQEIIELDEITRDDDPTPPVWARTVATDVATNDLIDRRLIAIVLRCRTVQGLPP